MGPNHVLISFVFCFFFFQDVDFLVQKARITPILKKMSTCQGTLNELKELLFWHLTFNIVPRPKQTYDFVKNALCYMETSRMDVFNYWAAQLKGETSRWK
jgi:hypothetical protein